jgi:penicillin amidase
MMALQNDNYNLRAAESLPAFLEYLDTTSFSRQERQAYNILKQWDYKNSNDSEGASYYEAWWSNLMLLTWDELTKGDVPLSRPTTFNTIKLVIEKPDFTFFDIQQTPEKENARDVVRKAFALSVEDIDDWIESKTDTTQTKHPEVKPHWADYKDSYLGHLMRLEPLNIHIRAGGGRDIVNAHSRTHGPSWRMIVSLEKSGLRAWATYPGGQSGNPGSPHYIDMLDRWLHGKYFALNFPKSISAAEATAVRSLSFNPSSQ